MIFLYFVSRWVCLCPSTMAWLHRTYHWVLYFCLFFFFSSLPISVTIRSDRCLHQNHFAEQSYCRHIPPRKPSSGLFLGSSNDTFDGYWSCVGTTLISPLFSSGGASPLPPLLSAGGPHVKKRPEYMIRRRRAETPAGSCVCSSNNTVHVYWSCIGTIPVSPLFSAGGPSPLPSLISAGGPPDLIVDC